ncbi:MAG: hypothetical protein H5T97_01335 [Firmicutes bacterium]|nr:hypothetical protein [Bacillota bacterium]
MIGDVLDGRPEAGAFGPVDLSAYGFTDDELAGLGVSLDGLAPDPELQADARRILYEYQLNSAGVSYQAQGYHTGDGVTVPAFKVDEHWLCHVLINEAVEARRPKTRR